MRTEVRSLLVVEPAAESGCHADQAMVGQPGESGRCAGGCRDHPDSPAGNRRRISSTLTSVISEPYISNYQDKPAIMVAAPIFDHRQRFIGVIGGASQNIGYPDS